jgi:hypothetical protein
MVLAALLEGLQGLTPDRTPNLLGGVPADQAEEVQIVQRAGGGR